MNNTRTCIISYLVYTSYRHSSSITWYTAYELYYTNYKRVVSRPNRSVVSISINTNINSMDYLHKYNTNPYRTVLIVISTIPTRTLATTVDNRSASMYNSSRRRRSAMDPPAAPVLHVSCKASKCLRKYAGNVLPGLMCWPQPLFRRGWVARQYVYRNVLEKIVHLHLTYTECSEHRCLQRYNTW